MAGPAVLVSVAVLAGCTAPGPAPGAASAVPAVTVTAPEPELRTAVQAALDRRAAAVLGHDVPPGDPAAHLADVPLATWAYRIIDVKRDGARATVRAELSHTLTGHDTGPVTGGRVLELTRDDRAGGWRVTADRPAPGAAPQLWEQGPVQVVRGARSLVLGVGHDPARLRDVAAVADRAVPAVQAAWPGEWAGRVVVLVPRSVDALGQLMGQPADAYRGIAAVTTGRTGPGGGAHADGSADRVIVNPEAYGGLGDFGQRFVLTHETVHVATRAHTTAATPLWLSEGFADWAAYRGSGRTPAENAPELRDAVRAGNLPDALPGDADFTFGGDAGTVARAYAGGWLACELIADRWGEDKLTAFYRLAGASGAERAFRDVLDTTSDAFTWAWRDRLRQEFSSAPSR
nr:hypothetical protein [Streptomyces sp. TRM64462]